MCPYGHTDTFFFLSFVSIAGRTSGFLFLTTLNGSNFRCDDIIERCIICILIKDVLNHVNVKITFEKNSNQKMSGT